jgi:Tfp pilus assembly protein PilX
MTPHSLSIRDSSSERGIALVSALLLMLVMSGLAIALMASGRVEVAMGDNEELYEGARAAAEAGLNHAATVIVGQIADPLTFALNDILMGPDGVSDPANPTASVNDDNGIISHLMFPGGPAAPWLVAPGSQYSYDVRLFDDDDPRMNNPLGPFSAEELIAMGPPDDDPEDGTGLVDVNKRIVIRATGFGPRGTVAVLEQMLQPIKMPALLVDGDVELTGNSRVLGDQGSVHSNASLEIDNTVIVEETATSTGTLTTSLGWTPSSGGLMSGGMPEIPVLDIHAINFIGQADFILKANGSITYPNGTVICTTNCQSAQPAGYGGLRFGWNFVNAGPNSRWVQLNDTVVSATYYAETDVNIGGTGGAFLALSVIAEGSISVSGTPNLQPEPYSQLLFVTDEDLDITGDLIGSPHVEGLVLVREQIHFSGDTELVGQVMVQDVPHTAGTPVDENLLEGNFQLTYNGIIETLAYSVSGWRETQR